MRAVPGCWCSCDATHVSRKAVRAAAHPLTVLSLLCMKALAGPCHMLLLVLVPLLKLQLCAKWSCKLASASLLCEQQLQDMHQGLCPSMQQACRPQHAGQPVGQLQEKSMQLAGWQRTCWAPGVGAIGGAGATTRNPASARPLRFS